MEKITVNSWREVSAQKFFLRVLASWLSMITVDLLLNAGLFAKLWFASNSFLLPPQELFRRIPLGYIAFFVQALVFVWLTIMIGIRSWKRGGLFGLKLGVMLNVASVLGLRSGTTANWTILFVWLVGGILLTTTACFMAGFASERGEKKVLLRSFLFLLVAIIVIVLLQSSGLVPAKRII
jgi:hypothetical protein